MKYRTFEELPVWQAAIDMAVSLFELCARETFRGHSGLRDQIERAAISISNNIAEGYERGTNEELLTFLYYARGSAGEIRSMLGFLKHGEMGESIRPEIEANLSLCLSISRQLGAWIESIKNSDYVGHRQQNDSTRQRQDVYQRQTKFLEELERVKEQARNKRPPDGSSG